MDVVYKLPGVEASVDALVGPPADAICNDHDVFVDEPRVLTSFLDLLRMRYVPLGILEVQFALFPTIVALPWLLGHKKGGQRRQEQ